MLTVPVLVALLALGLAAVALAVRRRLLSRTGGAIALSLRLRPRSQGRGWVLGVGRFAGDELRWFRVFSLARRPRRTLSRRGLTVTGRRTPRPPESMALLHGAQIVQLRSEGDSLELAMAAPALTGFLAWLDAAPPGDLLPER